MNTFAGIGAPKNTLIDVVERLNTEINAGLAHPSIRKKYDELGVTPFPGSPGELGKLMAA
jgi:tripartite-type tricarboxylate transporter receptor subunit TctC